jgi:hypothetical protein
MKAMHAYPRRHDIQHNDTQHNYTQYRGIFVTLSINDTKHNSASAIMLSVIELDAAFFIVMLSVTMLSVVMLCVVAPSLLALGLIKMVE